MDNKIPTAEEMRARYHQLRDAKDTRIARLVADVAAEWVSALEQIMLNTYGGTEPYASVTAYARHLKCRYNLGFDEHDILNYAAVVTARNFSERGFVTKIIHLTADIGVLVSWNQDDD